MVCGVCLFGGVRSTGGTLPQTDHTCPACQSTSRHECAGEREFSVNEMSYRETTTDRQTHVTMFICGDHVFVYLLYFSYFLNLTLDNTEDGFRSLILRNNRKL